MAVNKEELKMVFNDLGIGKNGYIDSLDEFARLCDYFNTEKVPDKEIEELFYKLDTDFDGKISQDELLAEMFRKSSLDDKSLFTPSSEDKNLSTATHANEKLNSGKTAEEPSYGNLNYVTRPDASDWLNYLDQERRSYVESAEVIDFWEKLGIPDGKTILKLLGFKLVDKIKPSDLSHALEKELQNPKNTALQQAAVHSLLHSTDKLWNDNQDLVEEFLHLNEEVDELKRNAKETEENLQALEQKKNMEIKLLQEANQKLREETSRDLHLPLVGSSEVFPEDIEELKKLQEELEKQLESSMEECNKLKQRNLALENEIQKLKNDLEEASNSSEFFLRENDQLLEDLKNEKLSDSSRKEKNTQLHETSQFNSFDFDDNASPEEIRRKVREEMESMQRRALKERKEVEGSLMVEISELERKHEEELVKLQKDHEKEKNELVAAHKRNLADAIAEKEKDLLTEFVMDKMKLPDKLESDSLNDTIARLEEQLQKKDEEINNQKKDFDEKMKAMSLGEEELKKLKENFQNETAELLATCKDEISQLKTLHQDELLALQKKHKEDIVNLTREHQSEMSDLLEDRGHSESSTELKLVEANKKIADMNEELLDMDKIIEGFEKKLKDSENMVEDLKAKLVKKSNEIESKDEQVKAKEAHNFDLQNKLLEMTKMLTILRDDNESDNGNSSDADKVRKLKAEYESKIAKLNKGNITEPQILAENLDVKPRSNVLAGEPKDIQSNTNMSGFKAEDDREKEDLKKFYEDEIEKMKEDFTVTLKRLNEDRDEKIAHVKSSDASLYDGKIKDIVNKYEQQILELKMDNDRKLMDLFQLNQTKEVELNEKLNKKLDSESNLIGQLEKLSRDYNTVKNDKEQVLLELASLKKGNSESTSTNPQKLSMNQASLSAERDLLKDQLKRTLAQLNDVTATLAAVTTQHRADRQMWMQSKEKLINPVKHQELSNELTLVIATNRKLQSMLDRSQSDITKMLTATRESYETEMKVLMKEKDLVDVQATKLRKLLEEKDSLLKNVDEKWLKADHLIKDLYTENSRLVKYLQNLEKQNIDASSKIRTLEEKCLVLGDLIRKLCPAALG